MRKHKCMFFNTQSWFFYGFQLTLIKQNLCLSNFNLDYNKIDFIYGFHLSSSNSSKVVTKQKCYKNWLVSTWKKLSLKESFKSANCNVCFETVRRPLHKARYETEKSHIAFWSSLSECLHIQKWYQIHIGVDFISVILTDLKFNTRYESFFAYLQYRFTGFMKTWKMIILSLKISFVDSSKVFLIVL